MSALWNSRSYRRQSALQKLSNDERQSYLNDFFLPTVSSYIDEHESISSNIIEACGGSTTTSSVAPILQRLYQNAVSNSLKLKKMRTDMTRL